jgi:hypothetical protein
MPKVQKVLETKQLNDWLHTASSRVQRRYDSILIPKGLVDAKHELLILQIVSNALMVGGYLYIPKFMRDQELPGFMELVTARGKFAKYRRVA